MNWNEVSALSDLIAAIAVVISLIYLALQVKSNTRAFRATIRDSAFRQLEEWNHVMMSNESLASLFQKGCSSYDSLEDAERSRFNHATFSLLKLFESIYIHYLEGSVGKDAWENNSHILFIYATQPGIQRYWKVRQKIFDPRYKEFVNSLNKNAEPILDAFKNKEETA